MKRTKLYVAAAMLLLAAGVHGQSPPPGPPGGFPAGAGAPPGGFGAGPLPSLTSPADDGIPPPHGRPDEDGPTIPLGAAKLSDRAPRPSADPKDFAGSWYHRGNVQGRIVRTMLGGRIAYTDEAKKILKYRREMENAGTPLTTASAKCYPTLEFALEINAPFYIVQSKDSLYFLFEEFHDIWQVRLNRTHQLAEPRPFKGDSIGYWDGNTLVIETRGYREPFWLDFAGTPVSKDARITRRMRKIDNGRAFEIITTIDDPQMYKETWSFARTFGWAPDKWMIGDYNCEQQVGGKAGAASYGVVEEGASPR